MNETDAVDIGRPPGDSAPCSSENCAAPLSWWWLRRIGFRIVSPGVDNKPHMMASVNQNNETGLEVAQSVYNGRWTVWLRSDIAHSRCRFCFVRNVETVGEMVKLIEAIQGATVVDVDFDADQFQESMNREAADCKRRYQEYCNDARWGRVPGGL